MKYFFISLIDIIKIISVAKLDKKKRHQEGFTPKFLNFKLLNSLIYKQCQSMLLKEEIKTKSSIISKQKK